MKIETQFIQTLLPTYYKTETRFNGIFCYDTSSMHIGMDDDKFYNLTHTIKVKYGKRFIAVEHGELLPQQTKQKNLQFMIYLKP